MDIIQINLHYRAPTIKDWRILLEQSFTAHVLLLTAKHKMSEFFIMVLSTQSLHC